MSDDALAEGVEHLNIDGVQVPVFNAARTIVDCFRFRNKTGMDVAVESLRDGWNLRKFTQDDLWRHATRGRVANVMRPRYGLERLLLPGWASALTTWPPSSASFAPCAASPWTTASCSIPSR